MGGESGDWLKVKEFDKDVKKQVKEWVKECLQESPPDASQLTSDIYYGESPTFVRGIENTDRLLWVV